MDDSGPLGALVESRFGLNSMGEGYSRNFASFFKLAVLMGVHDGRLIETGGIPLTPSQEKSFWLLWKWWETDAQYCRMERDDNLLAAPAEEFRNNTQNVLRQSTMVSTRGRIYDVDEVQPYPGRLSAISARKPYFFVRGEVYSNIQMSMEQSMWQMKQRNLFEAEFSSSEGQTTVKMLESLRSEVAEMSSCRHVALECYYDMAPSCGTQIPPRLDHRGNAAVLAGKDPRCTTGTSVNPCPWLPRDSGLPFYLWDLAARKTIRTEDLCHSPSYVAISHTWGRWENRASPAVDVEGVESWKIPQNYLFDVTRLPEILANIPIDTSYVWFDLLCIPQDKSVKANEEIARQAIIFRGASHSIAWLNGIESWDGVRAAIRWMSMYYLLDQLGEEIEGVREVLQAERIEMDAPTGLFYDFEPNPNITRKEFSAIGWFTSLWTLQEVCLRPDMLFCNKGWELLRAGPNTPVAIDTLISLTVCCAETHQAMAILGDTEQSANVFRFDPTLYKIDPGQNFRKLISLDKQHRGFLELLELWDRTGLKNLGVLNPEDILLLASQRECTSGRAVAIMSVIGVTEWDYLNQTTQETKSSHSQDKGLILDQYPLEFVQKVAAKIGAAFFNSISASNLDPMLLAQAINLKPMSSLMPFNSLTSTNIEHKFIRTIVYGVEHDHPAVKSWTVEKEGTVSIPEAGIVTSSHDTSTAALRCGIWVCHSVPDEVDNDARKNYDTDFRFKSVDLRAWVKGYLPSSNNYAIVLCENERVSRGILLKESQVKPGVLFKIGNFAMDKKNYLARDYQVLDRKVNWIVL